MKASDATVSVWFVLAVFPLIVLLWAWAELIVLLWAWAVATLWAWFVVPLGVMPLSKVHAYGLSLLVGLLTHQHMREHDEGTSLLRLLMAFVRPLLTVGLGWLVRLFA